jgi:hypothetical protein
MPLSPNELREVVVAAGVRLQTNCRLAMTRDAIDPDCECTVIVGGQPPADGAWIILPGVGLFLRNDGRAAAIALAGNSPDILGMQMRSIAPFAAALQGRITLHASCVKTEHGLFGLVGASGVGKSTFARHLAKQGCQIICDDLLAIRFVDDHWIVPTFTGNLPLSGLYFVVRSTDNSNLRITRLLPKEALLAHIRNGFGELHNSAVWRAQFKAYSGLSRSVPSFQLDVPDDLPRLPRNTATWLLHAAEAK